jgi:elongation factor P
MLEVTELRKGTYFQEDGVPFEVINYEHIKMGRGTATVKVKVKNVLNGSIVMKSFISGNRVQEAMLEEDRVRFVYRTGTDFIFEKEGEDEPLEISREKVGGQGQFLQKGMEVKILSYEGNTLSIELPIKATFTVKEAPPDARGNTVSGSSYKEVLLEGNVKAKVPMFIKVGERIIIDTRTGEYVSRE